MSATYYHGGVPGLKVGDMILPSCETGAPSTADYGAAIVCRRDRVYVSTVFQDALVFAAMHQSGDGRIYEVEPVGELVPDNDCLQRGHSFECERARVVRFWDVSAKTKKKVRRAMMEDAL